MAVADFLRGEGGRVFIAATLLLIPGMTWGIPSATGPEMIRGWDVDGVAGMAVLSELHNLLVDPSPSWYVAYPMFHYLLQGAVYAPYVAGLVLTGGLASPLGEFPFGFADPAGAIATLHVLSRVIAILMGAGIVTAAYLTVRRLSTRGGALLAAAVVLTAEPLIYYSHTGNLDVPALFWISLALLLSVRASIDGLTTRRAVGIGILSGIAVATKDQAYAVLVPGLLWLAVRHLRRQRDDAATLTPASPPTAPLLALGASGALALAIAGGIVFWPGRFVAHVRYLLDFETSFANVRHPTYLTLLRDATPAGMVALVGDTLHAVREAVGLPVAMLGLIALPLALARARETRMLAWSAVGLLVLAIFPIHHMQYRYALFPIYAMACCIGVAARLFAGRSAGYRAAAFGVAGAALAWEAVRAADFVRQQQLDARYPAGAYAAAHMAAGDEAGYFGGTHQLPHLPAGVRPVWLFGDDADAVLDVRERRFRWIVVATDYFSAESRQHSAIMPDSVFDALVNGSYGYRLAAQFSTPSLIGREPYYLPYVNPRVRIFERAAPPVPPGKRRRQPGKAPPF